MTLHYILQTDRGGKKRREGVYSLIWTCGGREKKRWGANRLEGGMSRSGAKLNGRIEEPKIGERKGGI